MAHDLVKQENNRGPVGLGDVKGFHRNFKNILMIGSGHDNDGMISVASPPGLHHITLASMSRNAGGRTAALNIDDHAGHLGHDCIAKGFLFQ